MSNFARVNPRTVSYTHLDVYKRQVLRARWTLDRLPAATAITRNWPLYTLLVILLFAVIAAFLPLGDTYLLSVVLSLIHI